jgi:hypothetical protein
MNMALGWATDGRGVSRATSGRRGAKLPVPTRTATPYTVHDRTASGVVGGKLETVLVVLLVVVVAVVGVGAAGEPALEAAGGGDTVDATGAGVAGVGVLVAVVPDAPDAGLAGDLGVALTPAVALANGSRGVLAGGAGAEDRPAPWFPAAAAPATGGGGGTGGTSARAFFRNIRGTAMTATRRSTTTGHSRRSSRSRRSELIIGLRSWRRRKPHSAGRSSR